MSYKQSETEGKFGNFFCHLLKKKNVSVFVMIGVLEAEKWKETPPSWETCGHSTTRLSATDGLEPEPSHLNWEWLVWTGLVLVGNPGACQPKHPRSVPPQRWTSD